MYPSIIDHCHCIYHPQLLQMDVGKVTIMLNIDRYCEICMREKRLTADSSTFISVLANTIKTKHSLLSVHSML